jgi:hypothetical protein
MSELIQELIIIIIIIIIIVVVVVVVNKIIFTNEGTFYLTDKMLKFTIKTSIHSPLHVSVHLDHLQGAYGDPC